jgi:Spy/CpxP family protein refolding chaperone
MSKFTVLAGVLFLVLVGALVRADDPASPSTQPSGSKSGVTRVSFKPYSALTSLSQEQADKITAIHKKFLDDQRELERKANADIMALLTDDQKTELKAAHEKDLADGKAKRADMRQKMKDEKASDSKDKDK